LRRTGSAAEQIHGLAVSLPAESNHLEIEVETFLKKASGPPETLAGAEGRRFGATQRGCRPFLRRTDG
jgi:hypothetical protein